MYGNWWPLWVIGAISVGLMLWARWFENQEES